MSNFDGETRKLIEGEVQKQVGKLLRKWFILVGAGTLLTMVTWVPSQAARLTLSDPVLKDVRDRILMNSGALESDTRRLRGVVDSASRELDDLSVKVAELQKTDVSLMATRVAALNALGDDAKKILEAIDKVRAELRAEIPKGVRVSFSAADHMGWGNRNSHQHFCPQRGENQVMVSGAIGANNLDFSVACGRIELIR